MVGEVAASMQPTILLTLLVGSIQTLSLDHLFPYGLQFGDSPLLEGRDDATSSEVHLSVPLKYYGRDYLSIFVSDNMFTKIISNLKISIFLSLIYH